jgi:RNA polymerase sigma factor (sigma-70 family)
MEGEVDGNPVVSPAAIVAGVIASDPAAESALLRLCWRHRPGFKAGMDASVGEEIAQELALKTWQAIKRGEIDTPSSLPGFMYTTRLRLVAGWHRRLENRPATRSATVSTEDVDIVDAGGTPETITSRKERVRLAEAALGRLRPDERAILTGAYSGRKLDDIAAEMGLPPVTVRSRKMRAEAKMRFRLRGCANGH